MTAALVVAAAAALVLPTRPAGGRLRRLGARTRARRPWVPPGRALALAGAAAAGVAAAGIGGGVAGLLVGVTWLRQRARARLASTGAAAAGELADALARITDELRAGAHPAAALAGLDADGPAAREVLRPAAAASRLGETVPAALTRAQPHSTLAADVERVAAAWALSDRHGVPLADLLAGVGSELRWRVEFGRRVRAELAGPRATATVLTILPALGLGLGQLMGADPLGVLRDGVLGSALLVVGVALCTAGMTWSEHILRSAVPR